MRAATVLAIGIALAGLSACAPLSGGRTFKANYVSYSPSHFIYAATNRDFLTRIYGNPFGGDAAALRTPVLAAIQGATFIPTNFTTTPSETARRDYFLVILFNGPLAFHPQDLCAEAGGVATDRTVQPVRFALAFCHKNRAISTIEGRAPAAGPSDPVLGRALRQAIVELLPGEEIGNDIGICDPDGC